MKVRTLSEIKTTRGIVSAGQIIEIDSALLERLKGKVELVIDGKFLPHYCPPADCWCSEKLPQKNFPSGCIMFNCKHHEPTQ